jgi:hypothetical protein
LPTVEILLVGLSVVHDSRMPDLRPVFSDRTTTHPGLLMTAVASSPLLRLDPDAVRLLRDGLGGFDMDFRWLVQLDSSNVLRLWRSWTGHQIYEAAVYEDAQGRYVLDRLMVEQHPDRYRGSLADEPGRFETILTTVINLLRRFRAGYTPDGPAPDADPEPPTWP